MSNAALQCYDWPNELSLTLMFNLITQPTPIVTQWYNSLPVSHSVRHDRCWQINRTTWSIYNSANYTSQQSYNICRLYDIRRGNENGIMLWQISSNRPSASTTGCTQDFTMERIHRGWTQEYPKRGPNQGVWGQSWPPDAEAKCEIK